MCFYVILICEFQIINPNFMLWLKITNAEINKISNSVIILQKYLLRNANNSAFKEHIFFRVIN